MTAPRPYRLGWLVILFALGACGGGGGGGPWFPPPVRIDTFTAASLEVVRGNSVHLSWSVTGATNCSLTLAVDEVPTGSDSLVGCTGAHDATPNVPPNAEFLDYTLTASSDSGDSDTATLRIRLIEPAYTTEIISFTAHPLQIGPGEEVTITWEAINTGAFDGVASCSLSRRSELQEASQAVTVSTACNGSITEVPEVAPGATYVRYQFNALKDTFDVGGDPADAFLYEEVVVEHLPVGFTGEVDWTVRLGTSSDGGLGVDLAPDGSIWAVGWTFGIDTGMDALVYKLSATGAAIWSGTIASDGTESAAGVAVDQDGNAIVVGTTTGDIGGSNAGQLDVFVRKLSAAGSTLWTRQFGTANDDYGSGVATDAAGNIYVVGTTYGALQGPSGPSRDAFVRMYTASGDVVWTVQFENPGSDDATAIAVDSRGRLLVVGSTTGTWDASDPTADNSRRALVLSLDDVGTVVWARHIAAPKSSAYGLSIAVDSTDAVIVAGYTLGNVIPGGGLGAEDAFVSKFDSAGAHMWSWQDGTDGDERAFGVTTDSYDNVVVAVGNPPEYPYGYGGYGGGAFLTKLYATGQVAWSNRFDKYPWVSRPSAITTDKHGFSVVVGDSYMSTGGGSSGFTVVRFRP